MNRVPFFGHKRLQRHARIASRWRRRSAKGNHEKTRLYARSNPGTTWVKLSELVRETAAEFRRKYGGQAAGWAADAASTARDEGKRRFFRRVTDLLRYEQYAINPKRGRKHRGGRLKSRRWSASMPHELKNGERDRKRMHKRRRHYPRYRRNPKRDGSPTRGEKRKDKYKDYLRSLRERGDKAAAELNKLLGRGVHKAHAEPALKAATTETQLEHPGHYAAEQTSDQKFAQESLSQVEALMADVRSQMQELGDDDEALADELSDQLVKLGDQRRALQARVKGTPAMSNPGRRYGRGRNPRYTSPARYRRMSTDQRRRYREALRRLRATVRSLY